MSYVDAEHVVRASFSFYITWAAPSSLKNYRLHEVSYNYID